MQLFTIMNQRTYLILILFLSCYTSFLTVNGQESIKIGVHYNPPLCSIDSSKQAKGIFIDIINKVAEINNWSIEYIPTTITTGFEDIQYGKIDLLSTIAKTKEREQLVLFNDETIYTNWGVIYCNKNTGIENITDLNGKTIALEKGDIHAKAILKLLNDFKLSADIVWCNNVDEVFDKIITNEADAGTVNKLYGYQKNINQSLKATSIFFNPVNVQIAGGPLTGKLLKEFDTALIQIKSEHPNFLEHTVNRWLLQEESPYKPWNKTLLLVFLGLTLTLTLILILQRRIVKLKSRRLDEAQKLGAQRAKTIRQLEHEKTLILNSLDELVIFMDNDYKLVWANDAFKKTTSIPFERAIGKKCHKIYFNEDTPCDFCLYETCLKTNRTEIREHIHHRTGKIYTHKIHPVYDIDQRPIGFVEILSDITEKKKHEEELIAAKEKAEQSDYMKSAFLANMSHEIRTPMNAIIGFSELLEDDDLSREEKKNYLNIIQSNGNQLLKLISDILIFSQIESGHVKLQYSTISVTNFLTDTYKQFDSEIKKSNKHLSIELISEIDEQLELETDIVRLKQIVFNLLTNAIKFTEKGNITIGARIEHDQLIIFIKDTGIGIPKEKHREVFKRFSQVTDNKLRKASGTGLGLTIAHDLIKQLGGSITLESAPGQGSTFCLIHPLTRFKPVKGGDVINSHILNIRKDA